jgi:hypothetical protein
MEPRLTRLAKNEAVFRDVNERITEISQDFAPGSDSPVLIDGLICECSDPECLERIGPLTIREYKGIREDPTRFIIVAGHQAHGERVVDRQQTYWTVEKHEGPPSDVARERDPRS